MTKRRRVALGGGVALAATLVSGTAAQARDPIVVTNTDDTGTGSLRDAVTQANGALGLDSITFASGVTGTITLGQEIPITDQVIINGPGQRNLTISGNDHSRIFDINATATILGFTFTGGKDVGGGAIKVDSGTNLSLGFSTITGNDATTGVGGGIWGAGDDVDIAVSQSTISGNKGAKGGGIYSSGAHGYTKVLASTLSGNQATTDAGGGGIFSSGGTTAGTERYLSLGQATLANNTAVAGGYASGGGVRALHGTVYLRDAIVGHNNAVVTGSRDISLGTGADIDAAFSLVQDASGLPASNITGQDPKLGPLQNNGGPSDTLMPAADSPVIDKGSTGIQDHDQRGLPLKFDFPGIANSSETGADASDIGAVERQAPVVSSVSPGSALPGSSVTISGTNLDGASQVLFGSTPAAFVTQPDGSLSAVVPGGSGTVDVHVVVGGAASDTAPGDQFTFLIPPQTPAGGQGSTLGALSLTGPVKVGKDSVSFTVKCASGDCSGAGALTTVERLRGKSVIGLSKRTRTKTVGVGKKSFKVAAGKKKTVTIKLNGGGKKLLRRFGKLPVRLKVTAKKANGKSATVKSKRVVFHAQRKKH
jgi:hypothetical protein